MSRSNLDANELKASATVPLLSGTRLLLAQSLANNHSYYRIAMLLPALAEEVVNMPAYLQSKFVKSEHRRVGYNKRDENDDEENDEENDAPSSGAGGPATCKTRTEMLLRTGMADEWARFQVFMAIPRPMLESIVWGTVAWDYDRSRGGTRDHYKEAQGFGVYVIGLSVQGREGAWLTARELQRLVGDLERYLQGVHVWQSQSPKRWPEDADAKELKEHVSQIDNQYGVHKLTEPRYVTSPTGLERMQDLVKSLKARVAASLNIYPVGDTPMIQTPLYVGMSIELKNRMPKHSLDVGVNSKLKSSNKAYGLVCSLMKHMDRTPMSTCLCVTRLWAKKDLPFAETLVCALANGLVCQDGFNQTECGDGSNDTAKRVDGDGEAYVMERSSWLYENSKQVVQDLCERVEVLEASEKLRPLLDGQTAQDVEELESRVDLLEREGLRNLQRERRKLQKKLKAAEASKKMLQEDEQILDLLANAFR